MQIFAKVENFVVTNVIVASQEVIDSGLFGSGWIETWVEKIDNPRKNYAGIEYTYDPQLDAFIPPQPTLGNWVLNEETCLWEEIPNSNVN